MLQCNVRKGCPDLHVLAAARILLPGTEPRREKTQPLAEQWQNFWRTLNRLNVWCWEVITPNSAMVCDGVGWSADIPYSDRSLVSSGDNSFPGWGRKSASHYQG
jgi:hypothetical protein